MVGPYRPVSGHGGEAEVRREADTGYGRITIDIETRRTCGATVLNATYVQDPVIIKTILNH